MASSGSLKTPSTGICALPAAFLKLAQVDAVLSVAVFNHLTAPAGANPKRQPQNDTHDLGSSSKVLRSAMCNLLAATRSGYMAVSPSSAASRCSTHLRDAMGLSHTSSAAAEVLNCPHVCGQADGVLGAARLLLAANAGHGVPGSGPGVCGARPAPPGAGVAGAALRTVLAMRAACGAWALTSSG